MKSKVYFIKAENGEGVASLAQKTGQLFDFGNKKALLPKLTILTIRLFFYNAIDK